MTAPAIPTAAPAEPVTFSVDLAAERGNVIPSLASLLIQADRRRRERQATGEQQAGTQTGDNQEHESLP